MKLTAQVDNGTTAFEVDCDNIGELAPDTGVFWYAIKVDGTQISTVTHRVLDGWIDLSAIALTEVQSWVKREVRKQSAW